MSNDKVHQPKKTERCPHCGARIDVDIKYTYQYHAWGTPAVIVLLSLMLMSLDYFTYSNLTWSLWAILGLWLLYIPMQLLRNSPEFAWLVIPFLTTIFSIFLLYLDKAQGSNTGVYGYDWGPYAVIPLATFFVVLPILAHFARKNYTEYDRLLDLIDSLEGENNA